MTTDYIILSCIAYLFFKGWTKGFLRTILKPISLIIGSVIGYMYYQKTQDLTAGLLISILCPFLLPICISLILKVWDKTTKKKEEKLLSLPSRLLGVAISIAWGGCFLAIILILIGLVPLRFGWFEKIQNDVQMSTSYSLLVKWTGEKLPTSSADITRIADIYRNPEAMEKLQTTKEFESIVEDKRLKEIFSDEETLKQIESKDYKKIMSNPKIQSILQDKELLKKFFDLNKIILEEGMKDTDSLQKSKPKYIDIE